MTVYGMYGREWQMVACMVVNEVGGMYGSEWHLVTCITEDMQTIYSLLFNNEEFCNAMELIYIVITLHVIRIEKVATC